MYPLIHIGNWITIYTFGIFLILSWGIFFLLLQYFSLRRGISKPIFSQIALFTISIFFASRIGYILTEWRTEKWMFVNLFESGGILGFLREFFISDNYNLSFAGGVLGFLIVFFTLTRQKPREKVRYWDAILPAFLIAGAVGYMGAFLGGQIYGVAMNTFFSVQYTNPDSIVPLQSPTFPLAVFYSTLSLAVLGFLFRLEQKTKLPEGFFGLMGMGIFMMVLFLGEFMNGASDLFSSRILLNLTQIVALGLIGYSLVGLIKMIRP